MVPVVPVCWFPPTTKSGYHRRLGNETESPKELMRKNVPAIVFPGGGGYLGTILAHFFSGQEVPVVVLTRHPQPSQGLIHSVLWDGETVGEWAAELEGAAAVVNLAGRTVNCRYNARNKQEIYDSRLKSTRAIGEAIARCTNPPRVWINSSSATIYRHAEDRPMDEDTGELGSGFSVDVCQKWEQALVDAPTPETRKVALRTAMVFGAGKGGVFEAFRRIVRLGLGGTLGNGRQFVSWVHECDFCRAVQWIVNQHEFTGAINVAAPNPIPNREFMRIFRRVCGQPVGLPATKWMLEIGAILLQTETELLLKSRRVVPGRLIASGFTFDYPDWEKALQEICRRPTSHFGETTK